MEAWRRTKDSWRDVDTFGRELARRAGALGDPLQPAPAWLELMQRWENTPLPADVAAAEAAAAAAAAAAEDAKAAEQTPTGVGSKDGGVAEFGDPTRIAQVGVKLTTRPTGAANFGLPFEVARNVQGQRTFGVGMGGDASRPDGGLLSQSVVREQKNMEAMTVLSQVGQVSSALLLQLSFLLCSVVP